MYEPDELSEEQLDKIEENIEKIISVLQQISNETGLAIEGRIERGGGASEDFLVIPNEDGNLS